MVNKSELLINVVNHNKPKVLIGLNQKVKEQEMELSAFHFVDVDSSAKRQDLTHSVAESEQGKPVCSRVNCTTGTRAESLPQGEPMDMRVKEARRSKCLPVIRRIEADVSPERGLTSGWSPITITNEVTKRERRKAKQ